MKDIRIERLTLDHFKGQRHFELVPDGQSCAVYGDNAVGKTTLYDGLTWLLFGKDSAGRSDFEIKPLGKDGQVLVTKRSRLLRPCCGWTMTGFL